MDSTTESLNEERIFYPLSLKIWVSFVLVVHNYFCPWVVLWYSSSSQKLNEIKLVSTQQLKIRFYRRRGSGRALSSKIPQISNVQNKILHKLGQYHKCLSKANSMITTLSRWNEQKTSHRIKVWIYAVIEQCNWHKECDAFFHNHLCSPRLKQTGLNRKGLQQSFVPMNQCNFGTRLYFMLDTCC